MRMVNFHSVLGALCLSAGSASTGLLRTLAYLACHPCCLFLTKCFCYRAGSARARACVCDCVRLVRCSTVTLTVTGEDARVVDTASERTARKERAGGEGDGRLLGIPREGERGGSARERKREGGGDKLPFAAVV